jgi:hypothetical protein
MSAYRYALTRNQEDAIRASLRNATSAAVRRQLWEALDRATQSPSDGGPEALALRLFALPLLVVTGGRAGATVPGVLPDVRRIEQVLAVGGALGPSRNFGFGNALCSMEALESIPYCRLWALQGDPGSGGAAALDLPPAALSTGSAEEEVHLRFIVGAGVVAAGAPSFVETGSAIGDWGMRLTQELAEQMRMDDLSVLPIPRPPASLLAAQPIGMIACEDLSLQAFISRILRRFRSEVGEPEAALAALASGAIGLRFASPFVENRVSVHRRALHATEDLGEAMDSVLGLLRECGVGQLTVLPGVVEDAVFARNPAASVH